MRGVALLARDQKGLDRARAQLGHGVLTFAADVADEPAVNAAVAAIADRWGDVDVLMHVAGIVAVGPERTMTMEDYRRHMDTHLFGAVNAVNAVLPAMRDRKRGSIVPVSSVGGRRGPSSRRESGRGRTCS